MTLPSLLWRNLLYFWRGNLAVALGVLVGGTVLTGALFVGDSLRGSLRELTDRRLGWVDHALVAPRFFRAGLAAEVARDADARVGPALLLRGTAFAGDGLDRRQTRGVSVLGVGADFFAPSPPPAAFADRPDRPRAWLSRATAEALGVGVGDRFSVQLQKAEALPREAGLGKKDVALEEWELTVAAVLGDGEWGAAFNLRPEIESPRNVLVRIDDLQKRLDLAGQANALLARGDGAKLTTALKKDLSLDDWGLAVRAPAGRAPEIVRRYDNDRDGVLSFGEWYSTSIDRKRLPRYAWAIEDHVRPANPKLRTRADLADALVRAYPYLSVESKQLLLSPQVVTAAQEAAKDADLRAAPAIVYLCRIEADKARIAGVVAALDRDQAWPLGPFAPAAGLGDGQIVLREGVWPGTPPTLTPSSTVRLKFKPPEQNHQTGAASADVVEPFAFAGYLPGGGVASDPFLTPDFPGITDRDDLGAWSLPFDDPDWQKNVGKEYGDLYWKQLRGTPKAYVSLSAGKRMWGSSRFGEVTSVRLALPGSTRANPPTAAQLDEAAGRYRAALLARLDPVAGGFVFDDVRAAGVEASQGGTPFGLLFLGFSFFLILSALLLVGLLYRLNLERRGRQVGVLSAEGFSRGVVGRLLLGEGMALAVVGAVAALLTAFFYSRLLVDFLAWAWPGGALRSLLRSHVSAESMGYGVAGTLLAAGLTVWWVARSLSRVVPRALLSGRTTDQPDAKPSWWLPALATVALLSGLGLLVAGFFVHGQEARAGTFFGGGMMFLTAGLCGVRLWMRQARGGSVAGGGWGGLARLGVRNAARHPTRSLLAVGLLASAVFLIVAVESFRRKAAEGTGDKDAPDGGFSLMAESDLPLFRDPATPAGRKEIVGRLRSRLAEAGVAEKEIDAEASAADALLAETTLFALRARAGDDASCLNLYKPRSPRVLGVPRSFVERGGFAFDTTQAKAADEKANPWRVLLREGDVPAFGEKNTVQWMLRTDVGGKVAVPDERGRTHDVTVAGLLHDSVFQSSLVVSEEQFLRLYPTNEGYTSFLIAPPRGREAEARRLLERALADRGFAVTPTRERLEAYLAVENTYLSTFQALGGLGLLLGSLGLAVVLLRSVWERRAELALLRALGYRRLALAWLVLSENAFLLLVGLAVGVASALLSISPQLARGAGAVPWPNLTLLFAGVLALALTAATAATALTLRAPIVPALRRE